MVWNGENFCVKNQNKVISKSKVYCKVKCIVFLYPPYEVRTGDTMV